MPAQKSILIMDDEKECAGLLKDYFSRRGFLVDTAYDGLSGKALLEENKYDYVFFDCNMPGLGGIEIAGVIRQNNPSAKRIMFSGYDLEKQINIEEIGIDLFLQKPFPLSRLGQIIDTDT